MTTYIVKLYGDAEVGILEKVAPKTYIVRPTIWMDGEWKPYGVPARWPKERCIVATERTLELVREFERLSYSHRKERDELWKKHREIEKSLIEQIQASAAQPETLPG